MWYFSKFLKKLKINWEIFLLIIVWLFCDYVIDNIDRWGLIVFLICLNRVEVEALELCCVLASFGVA